MSDTDSRAIGIDFGGTNVKMAAVNTSGKILSQSSIPTEKISAQRDWLQAVALEIPKLASAANIASDSFDGIGVGVPGFIDFDRGYVHSLANVPGWVGVYLKEMLEEKMGMRVVIDNDVNAMALGESKWGAGRDYDHVVFVTLGTGVGGAILIHKQIYRGAYSMAGEIGHMSIDKDGPKSPEGYGGLEQYVGNRRIVERVQRLMEGRKNTLLSDMVDGDLGQITPKIIAEAAHSGDQLSLEIFDFVADCLASAFASITYVLQPEVFILGGGVAQSGEVLWRPLLRHLKDRLTPILAERVKVIPAELGNNAGMIGSAGLLWAQET